MKGLPILPSAAIVLATILSALPFSRAEILVYDLSFSTIPSTVNYDFVQDGYLIVDAAAGTFSSVIVLTDPDTLLPYYTTSLVSGTYSILLNQDNHNEYAVLTSTSSASAGSDNVSLQIVGGLEAGVRVGGGQQSDVARRLRGVLFASGAQSSSTDASGSQTFTYGFAGQSRVRATFDTELTRNTNGNNLGSAGAIQLATQILINNGIAAGTTSNSTTSNSTTSNSTSSNSTTSNSTTSNSTTSNSTTTTTSP